MVSARRMQAFTHPSFHLRFSSSALLTSSPSLYTWATFTITIWWITSLSRRYCRQQWGHHDLDYNKMSFGLANININAFTLFQVHAFSDLRTYTGIMDYLINNSINLLNTSKPVPQNYRLPALYARCLFISRQHLEQRISSRLKLISTFYVQVDFYMVTFCR